MANTDNWGGVAVDETPKSDDWGGVAIEEPAAPKLPDTSGIQRVALDNLAQNDNKESSGDTKNPPQTPEQRLDIAAGMPVSSILKGGDNDQPLPAAWRQNLVSAYKNGHAINSADFAQTALHSILPAVAGVTNHVLHPIDTDMAYFKDVKDAYVSGIKGWVGAMAYPFVSEESQKELERNGTLEPRDTTPVTDVPSAIHAFAKGEQGTLGRVMGGMYAPISAILAPAINPAIEATPGVAEKIGVPSSYAKTIPDIIGMGMDIFGLHALGHMGGEFRRNLEHGPQFTSGGPWDNIPGHQAVRGTVGSTVNKSPDSVTSTDIDTAIANAFHDKAPAAQDFHDVAAAMGNAENVDTLHVVFAKTGVKPDQVFEDAQKDPQIARDVAAGKVPEQYEHLEEPVPSMPVEKAEKLQIARDETTRSFKVVDKDGDHVQGGFDSYAEAQHFIEDEKYKADERRAIQEEGELKSQDVLTPEDAKTTLEPRRAENVYSETTEKVGTMNKEQADLRLQSLNKKMEAGIITLKEMGEREALSEKQKPSVIPPSSAGRVTSLRSFLSNNGAKFNERNELVSIKRSGEIIKGASALEYAHEIAKEQGYLPKDDLGGARPVTDLQNALTDNGGRGVTREADAGRVAKAKEAENVRKNMDPDKIDQEAHGAGIDTSPVKGENEKQRIKRLVNELVEFYKNEEGAGETFRKILGDGIIKAEKFVGKLSGGFFEKLADGYIKTFQPELLGPLAARADSFLAKYKTARQEAQNSYYLASEKSRKYFDRMTDDQRMSWLYDHETGRWNTEDNVDHARFQAMYDVMHKAEQEAIGAKTAYKENYLPHQWERADEVKAFFNSEAMIKKYGADWFKKASEFRLIQEGVRAGFKLKTNNPESMLVARQLASDSMLRTMDLLKEMESSGIAKKASAFGMDKKIAKTEKEISDIQERYKKDFENIEKQAALVDENGKPIGEPVSKKMRVVKKRIDELNKRLAEFNEEKLQNKSTPEEMKLLQQGLRVIGPDSKAYLIHPQAAPLWKNAMEMKGLWEREGVLGSSFRGYMATKAAWVSTKLALSLFHPMHMVGIHLSSGIATAADHLIKGGKLSDLDTKMTSLRFALGGKETGANPLALNKDATLGFGRDHPAVKAWNTPADARTPEQARIVRTMVEGGFKPTMSAQEAVHFKENFNKAIAGVGVNNLRLIGAAFQAMSIPSAPIFQHWIPALKSESYLYRTDLALKRDPSLADDAGRRGEVFRSIAKDVDRNYGEMNQDVLFWNKTIKDAFNASMLSGGWKLAMLQNFRGLAEPAKMAYKYAKTGEFSKEQITHQFLQSYIYTAVMLAQGAIATYLMTGTVGNAISWAFPDTGDKNPDGSEIRLNQPAFLKEGFMLNRDINEDGVFSGTGKFLYHTTLIPGIAETLNNEDFVGRKIISNSTDLNQWAHAGMDSIMPITVSSFERAEQKGSKKASLANILGFPIAGAYINQTKFEQKVLHTYSEQNPPKDDVYSAYLKQELKGAISSGDTKEQSEIEEKMHDQGMTEKQIENAKKTHTEPFVNFAWTKLSVQDQKRLIDSASDKEKEKFKIKDQ